jgi:polyisoprenoid-binding protein YceI
MWGLAPVRGAFGEISGAGTVSATGEVTGTITVAAASIDTKIKRRDDHLRSADFFDAAHHPHIVFETERLTLTGDRAGVTGTLRVRDRTLSLTFPAEVSTSDDDEIQLTAELVVDRSELGLTWSPLRMATMKTTLIIQAVFTRS